MASKFSMVDPSQGDDVFAAMAGQVNDRLAEAVDEIGQKYQAGGNPQQDTSIAQPTGQSYRAAEAAQVQKVRAAQYRLKQAEENEVDDIRQKEILNQLEANGLSDDELADEETDVDLKRIREKRLAEIKSKQKETLHNLSKGHGQYREISQDEFLPEACNSTNVVCHFYHDEFMRCKILDKHLNELAPQHPECKFIKINAQKAPFFVSKLAIQTLPTLIIFRDGVAKERIRGFEGLSNDMPKDKEDEFPTWKLGVALNRIGAITYKKPMTMDDMRRSHPAVRGTVAALEEEDFSD